MNLEENTILLRKWIETESRIDHPEITTTQSSALMKDPALLTTTAAGLPTMKVDHPDHMTVAHAVLAAAEEGAADLLTVAAVVDTHLLLQEEAVKP